MAKRPAEDQLTKEYLLSHVNAKLLQFLNVSNYTLMTFQDY